MKLKVTIPPLENVPVPMEAVVPSPQLMLPLTESPAKPVQVRLAEILTPVCPEVGALNVQLGGPITNTRIGSVVVIVADIGGVSDASEAVTLTANPALLRLE